MTTAHLVHGFNVSVGGRATTDKLLPYLKREGYSVVQHDYGWKFLLGTLLCNPSIAQAIVHQATPGDIGIGHSNGCAILSRAAEQGAQFSKLVFLNPALDEEWVAPPHIEEVRVFYSNADSAVWWADQVPGVRWGGMGRYGFAGTDPRYLQYDMTPYRHSEVFNHLPTWATRIVPRNGV